jgi:hypothetical protein
MNGEKVKIGQAVKVVDEHGVLHDGLCENNHWGDTEPTGPATHINVVFVSGDKGKRDDYGRQKEHLSSCSHRDNSDAPGRYWFIEGGVSKATLDYYGEKKA